VYNIVLPCWATGKTMGLLFVRPVLIRERYVRFCPPAMCHLYGSLAHYLFDDRIITAKGEEDG